MIREKIHECYELCPFIKDRCPESNDPKKGGCPAWSEIIHTNIATQEEKLLCGCSYKMTEVVSVEVIRAANAPVASIDGIRNHIVSELPKLVQSTVAAIKGTIDDEKERQYRLQLEK